VKWILRYLKGTSRVCLCFRSGKPVLNGYTNEDMTSDVDFRKSTSGYMMTFAGGAVSWKSRLQKCVALSSAKAEYIVVTEAAKELMWMQKFLQELGLSQENMFYIVIVKVQSILARTQLFIQGQSILKSDIIGYGMH